MNFGEPKKEHGFWGIGDMGIHIYISPSLTLEHRQAAHEAVNEFFRLFSDKKDWFKISRMPWKIVEDVVKNQPSEPTDITDLLFVYYIPEMDKIYKDNKTPLTTVMVMPHNYVSGNNGAGTDTNNHVVIFDLMNIEHLKSVIKHEIGHRFGADHCLEANCIMNASGVGTHFCPECMKKMQLQMATMYSNSRPFTFGEPIKSKPAFTFGKPTKSM